MAYPGTIDNIRYLKRDTLTPITQIHNGYFREIIANYGIDCTYFRNDANFFESPSARYLNLTYGEDSTMSYWLSAEMVVFMNVHADSIMMNRFGLETDSDADIYILKDDFTEQFRDKIGGVEEATISTTISSVISAYTGTIWGNIVNTSISGYTSGTVTFATSGAVSGVYTGTFIRNPKKYNDYIYKIGSYITREVNGSLSGNYTGTLDLSGNGSLSGNIAGSLWYYTEASDNKNTAQNWGILSTCS